MQPLKVAVFGTGYFSRYHYEAWNRLPGVRLVSICVRGNRERAQSFAAEYGIDAVFTNPEEMLLASISTCHMLWFLHIASTKGLVVESYEDNAEAVMATNRDGSGQFTSATLRPHVTLSAGDPSVADSAHHKAHQMCFIVRSLNFDVSCEGTVAAV